MQPQNGRENPGPPRPDVSPVTADTVRSSFNDIPSVLYYTRAAHFLGLWKSERLLVDRFLPDTGVRILEAGCGAGRVAIGLWKIGYRRIGAFDFAGELLDQAQSLAREQGAGAIVFRCADATTIDASAFGPGEAFGGALFMFNGLMQIPGRQNRRAALERIRALCAPGAPFIFTTHDRDNSHGDGFWRAEADRWARGGHDPRLPEFGDRQFHDESGHVFIHIPDRGEILEDLAATGWRHQADTMRSRLASESAAVTEFSDDCRFWVARRDA
jgi:SAM-dependent methyltransferase